MSRSPLKDVPAYLKTFLTFVGRRLYVVFALSLFAAFAESFGIVLILPLLQGMEAEASVTESRMQGFVIGAMKSLGLEASTPVILVLIVVAFIAKGGLLFAGYAYRVKLRSNLQKRLKGDLYDYYTVMKYRYYTSQNTGHFINVINAQINQMLSVFESFVGLLSQVVTTVVYLALAFVITWRFGIMAVLAGGLLLYFLKHLNSQVRDFSRASAKENGLLARLLVQSLHAFKYLTATGQGVHLRRHVYESIERLTNQEYHCGLAQAFVNACREPIAVAFVAVIVLVQTVFLKQPLAPILVSILLLQRGLNSTMMIQGMWLSTLGQIGSVEMVRDEFEAQRKNKQHDGGTVLGPLTTGINFDQVHFRYSEDAEDVLKGISLTIPAETSVAFVGESGAGKSTLFDLLTLMLTPRSGTIAIDGVESKAIQLQSWRQQIGYVSQDTVVFDDTIANNICMWAGDPEKDMDLQSRIEEAARQAYIADFIATLPEGYLTQVGDRGIRLSGGQKQRLFIARELFRKPRLLILDEATSALDSESEHFIQQSIDALKGQTTVVIIAHRLSTIRNVDIVYVMDKGRIVEQGSYEELRNASGSRFERLVSMQAL